MSGSLDGYEKKQALSHVEKARSDLRSVALGALGFRDARAPSPWPYGEDPESKANNE
jgi:hypothetical protein